MVAWDGGISFVNYACPQCPKGLKWTFAGAVAGAATTIVGEFHQEQLYLALLLQCARKF